MTDISVNISLGRLYLLRIPYLLLVAGLGPMIWPEILHHPAYWDLQRSVVACMLGAMSALAVLGLRYPLQMLPLLFFEMGWKGIWLLVVALPLWRAHHLDGPPLEIAHDCLLVLSFPLFVPWDHVFRNYAIRPADPWRAQSRTAV